MSMRAARVRNLLLLIAIFATIVVAGCWDSRRTLQHVLDDGYSTVIEITGAQNQRLAPFAFDDWRPRFVEQGLSVNLKWNGKDGKPHTFEKVPVTDDFAHTIVEGDQVRLAVVPAKVMDDPYAVPVITADANARLRSLQEWTRTSAFIAATAWIGFGLSAFWIGRGGAGVAGQMTAAFPLRRILFGFVALILGAVLTLRVWSIEDIAPDSAGGTETTAEIASALTVPAAGGGTTHALRLSWKDAQGGVHHVGPVPVSEHYWATITRNGELTVHQARIRYQEGGRGMRPVVVDDPPERPWQIEVALGVGLVLAVMGAASLFSAARQLRRRG